MNLRYEYGGRITMSKTITGEALKKIVEDGKIIVDGTIENCGALKYDFVLSEEFLKAEFRSPQRMSDLSAYEKRNVVIDPGEVVYVLTKETVNIPPNMYMNLSANRGMSEYGVLTLGGFAVDPGYSGRLMFGLYNYSSTPFTLIPGKKLVGAVFFQLDDEETAAIGEMQVPKSINQFPPQLISIIGKYSPTGLQSLEDSIRLIKDQMESIRQELNKSKDELADLKRLVQDTQEQTNRMSRSINEVSNTVSDLSQSVKELRGIVSSLKSGLEDEIKLRKQLSEDLDKKLILHTSEVEGKIEDAKKDIKSKIQFLKGAAWLGTAVIGAIGTLFITWVAGWLKIG